MCLLGRLVPHRIDVSSHQCAPVRFIEGSNSTAGPTCTNGTSFTAEWSGATSTIDDETNTTSSSSSPEAATSIPAGAGTALKAGVGNILGFVLLAAGLTL